jgi:hypothetical protein
MKNQHNYKNVGTKNHAKFNEPLDCLHLRFLGGEAPLHHDSGFHHRSGVENSEMAQRAQGPPPAEARPSRVGKVHHSGCHTVQEDIQKGQAHMGAGLCVPR